MTQENGDADGLEFIYSEIAAAHDRQSDALDKIDAKTVLVVGYALGAGVFLATQHGEFVLAVLAYLALALAVAFAVLAYMVRAYEEIKPRSLFEKYYNRNKSDIIVTLAATRVKHYERNRALLRVKAVHWRRSLAALIVGSLLMIGAIFVHTVSHDHTGGARQPGRGAPASYNSVKPSGPITSRSGSPS
jgi:hypothetical protein